MPRTTSSVDELRCFQLSPPSSVCKRVPLLPTAQPRFWSRKKTECSHAIVLARCLAQVPDCAEVEVEQKSSRSRQQEAGANIRSRLDHLLLSAASAPDCGSCIVFFPLPYGNGTPKTRAKLSTEANPIICWNFLSLFPGTMI